MDVVETVAGMRAFDKERRARGKSLGFVPTMGALHEGHLSLVAASRQECDATVVSIFVNPTQFGPKEDLSRYPRPRERDLELCQQAGVDVVFAPEVPEMYPPGYSTFVDVAALSDQLEGAIRPGHFRGVATIVTKLLLIVGAERAYFGQKDYQQQTLLRLMAKELHIATELKVCPTVRAADGLALSSRNAYLSAEERTAGLSLITALRRTAEQAQQGHCTIASLEATLADVIRGTPGMTFEYGVVRDPETLALLTAPLPRMIALVAARVGNTRLIDNLELAGPAGTVEEGSC